MSFKQQWRSLSHWVNMTRISMRIYCSTKYKMQLEGVLSGPVYGRDVWWDKRMRGLSQESHNFKTDLHLKMILSTLYYTSKVRKFWVEVNPRPNISIQFGWRDWLGIYLVASWNHWENFEWRWTLGQIYQIDIINTGWVTRLIGHLSSCFLKSLR